MTSEEYVSERGWQRATLHSCPVHRDEECGLRAHGSYARKQPDGVRIARWYCARGQVTFSLLPVFLAASFSGRLTELETAVAMSEQAANLSQAARQLRPELEERSAQRWLRRRVAAIHRALTALVTSLPELMGTASTLSAVGTKLGAATGTVLVTLRRAAGSLLDALPTPLGLRHRSLPARNSSSPLQHALGPAPG